ncbi:MAG: prolyl oligopeptidase family serine peptidase [Saccharofermentanales bacterium]|nr:prolyl oligopeptidase family serine peptidase [Clostridiaceae bacterium]
MKNTYQPAGFPEGTCFLPAHRPGDRDFWQCTYIPDIVYSVRDGVELDLQLIVPKEPETPPPLVVYVQGSGWARQDAYTALPLLSHLAGRGFAVASVRFRDTSIAIFPAHLEDTKTAIRFLRANADQYGYHGEKVGIWGTSSGGHTAALVGLTAGLYTTDDYGQYPDDVQAVVDFYGPTDLLHMDDFPGIIKHNASDSPESLLVGGPLPERKELALEASPIYYVTAMRTIPPFLLVHGDRDAKVHFDQSARLYQALTAAGKEATLYAVQNADHGDMGVSGPAILDLVVEFFDKHLRIKPTVG